MYRQHYPDDPGMHNMPDDRGRGSTHVTYQRNATFCERVKQSLGAVVGGCVLLFIASGLLFWNEGRAVQTARSLEEGLASVQHLQTAEVAFEQNNGQLVHLSSSLKTSQVLYDSSYKVGIHAVKLRRSTDMYQWVEHESVRETQEGDETRRETTYSYSKEWRSTLVDSNSFNNKFGHENPSEIKVSAEIYTAKDAQIGNFYLSEALISKINNFQKLPVTEGPPDAIIDNGGFYHGIDPHIPEIGDIRVSFEFAGLSGLPSSRHGAPDVISVIAQQRGAELTSYQTEAGDAIELLYIGEYTAEKMFFNEQASNTTLTWGLRFAGWLLMFVGFGLLTRIFVTLVDWIPLIRDAVALGVMTLNATLSISLSLTVIALGWIRYRPWLGGSILVCSLIPFIFNKLRARNQPARPYPQTYRPFQD